MERPILDMPEGAPKNHESAPEKILSSEEVLQALSRYAEGYTLGRELRDDKGVHLREVVVKGEKEGEYNEYQYKRKGPLTNYDEVTVINVIRYLDGEPVGGERLATFSEETGEWTHL